MWGGRNEKRSGMCGWGWSWCRWESALGAYFTGWVYSSVRGDRSDHSGRKMDAASGNLDLQQVAEIHSEFPHQYQSFLCAGHEEPCPDGDTDSAAPVWIRAFRGGNWADRERLSGYQYTFSEIVGRIKEKRSACHFRWFWNRLFESALSWRFKTELYQDWPVVHIKSTE